MAIVVKHGQPAIDNLLAYMAGQGQRAQKQQERNYQAALEQARLAQQADQADQDRALRERGMDTQADQFQKQLEAADLAQQRQYGAKQYDTNLRNQQFQQTLGAQQQRAAATNQNALQRQYMQQQAAAQKQRLDAQQAAEQQAYNQQKQQAGFDQQQEMAGIDSSLDQRKWYMQHIEPDLAAALSEGSMAYTPEQKSEIRQLEAAMQGLQSDSKMSPDQQAAGLEDLARRYHDVRNSPFPVSPENRPKSLQEQFDSETYELPGQGRYQRGDKGWDPIGPTAEQTAAQKEADRQLKVDENKAAEVAAERASQREAAIGIYEAEVTEWVHLKPEPNDEDFKTEDGINWTDYNAAKKVWFEGKPKSPFVKEKEEEQRAAAAASLAATVAGGAMAYPSMVGLPAEALAAAGMQGQYPQGGNGPAPPQAPPPAETFADSAVDFPGAATASPPLPVATAETNDPIGIPISNSPEVDAGVAPPAPPPEVAPPAAQDEQGPPEFLPELPPDITPVGAATTPKEMATLFSRTKGGLKAGDWVQTRRGFYQLTDEDIEQVKEFMAVQVGNSNPLDDALRGAVDFAQGTAGYGSNPIYSPESSDGF